WNRWRTSSNCKRSAGSTASRMRPIGMGRLSKPWAATRSKSSNPDCSFPRNDGQPPWDPGSEFQAPRPIDVENKKLAIADAAGAGGAYDAVGHFVHALVAHPNADLHLGDEGHAVFAADVAIQVAFLAAVAFGLAHHTRRHFQVGNGAEDRFGAERFHHDGKLFHETLSASGNRCSAGTEPTQGPKTIP